MLEKNSQTGWNWEVITQNVFRLRGKSKKHLQSNQIDSVR